MQPIIRVLVPTQEQIAQGARFHWFLIDPSVDPVAGSAATDDEAVCLASIKAEALGHRDLPVHREPFTWLGKTSG
jgi:hypothetical protein